jgi:transcription antitermination protein NusB
MGRRRRARELALQHLYQWDFHGSEEQPAAAAWEDRDDPDETRGFAHRIVEGVKARQEEIDALLEDQSKNWKLYRMSRIDRNILRIAVFELLAEPEVPAKVALNEAIEIGKKFGTTESGAFINGILDQICRRLGKSVDRGREAGDDPAGDVDPG